MRISCFALLCTSWSTANAFVVNPSIGRTHTVRTSEHLISSSLAAVAPISRDRIKSAGGGIPVSPGGDRSLFDPEEQGKLQGTDELNTRLAQGSHYLPSTPLSSTLPDSASLQDTQHWLEDIGVPTNFAKPTAPVTAKILGRARLIADDAPGNIQHVVLQLPDDMHYVEGQSLSVIPPGIDAKTNKPYKPRLYSIASTRYGDLLDGKTVSLCVRQAEYYDPETGIVDETKAGVCSSFLCHANAGDTVSVAGPVGKTMLLPEDPTKDIIMVATGTGIAPFRSFLHRLFVENTVARHMFTGRAWLILGVPVTGGLLYPDEFAAMQTNANKAVPDQLELTYAISREQTNARGGKLYVQDVLAERATELLQRLDNGAVIYFCGLKGMMPGILEALEQVCTERGIVWADKLSEWKKNHQWHVEVY